MLLAWSRAWSGQHQREERRCVPCRHVATLVMVENSKIHQKDQQFGTCQRLEGSIAELCMGAAHLFAFDQPALHIM